MVLTKGEKMQADERLRIYVDKNEQKVISQLADILDDTSLILNDTDYANVIRAIAAKETDIASEEAITICYEF